MKARASEEEVDKLQTAKKRPSQKEQKRSENSVHKIGSNVEKVEELVKEMSVIKRIEEMELLTKQLDLVMQEKRNLE